MKTKNLIISAVSFLMIFLVSCSEDVVREPSPEVNPDCIGVYFPSPNKSSYELELTVDSITVRISRLDSSAAITVPIVVLRNDSNIFVLPDSVSFAANQASTTFNVYFPSAELAVAYTFEIKVEGDELVNAYKNIPTKAVTISKIKWNKVAEGTFTSGFFGESWSQDLYKAQGTKKYRLFDLWVTGYNYDFSWSGISSANIVPGGTLNTTSGYYVQTSGYVYSSYGMVMTATDSDPEYTYFNAADSTFTFNMKWYVSAGSFGWKDEVLKVNTWL
jgi:hypothetical protein